MTTANVIGQKTRWGEIVAVGFIAGEHYVWCEQPILQMVGRTFLEFPVVSMLPWALVFPPASEDAVGANDSQTDEASR